MPGCVGDGDGDGDGAVGGVGEWDGPVSTLDGLDGAGLPPDRDTVGLTGPLDGEAVVIEGPPAGPELPMFGAKATGAPADVLVAGGVAVGDDEDGTLVLVPPGAGVSTGGAAADSVTPLEPGDR